MIAHRLSVKKLFMWRRFPASVAPWPALSRLCFRALIVLSALCALSGCWSLQNRWRLFSSLVEQRDLPYLDDGHPKHALHIFAPPNAKDAPVVIFVHGGYWRSGDRSYFERVLGLYANVGVALAEQGMVVAIPSYRLFPEVKNVEFMLDDIGATMLYVQENARRYGGDPKRIFLMGHSAGAHLVALLSASPENLRDRNLSTRDVRGFISISGVYDIESCAANANPPRMKEELWDPLFGNAASKRKASPIHDLKTKEHPPALFLVGENDYPNCLRDFASVQHVLQKRQDREAEFVRLPGLDHEQIILSVGGPADLVTPRVIRFIARQNRLSAGK